jgi:DNA-binding response OmpR family regulator
LSRRSAEENSVTQKSAPVLEQADEHLVAESTRLLPRDPSAVDLCQRLSHDADPANMLQRLSIDASLRRSYDTERKFAIAAPQQLDPKAAASVFLSASAPLPPQKADSGSLDAKLNGTSNDKTKTISDEKVGADSCKGRPDSPRRPTSPPPSPAMSRRASWFEAAAAVAAAERAGSVTILSVDDDPINQMVIQAMLRRAGFKVLAAGNGSKALEMLGLAISNGEAPDLMLLDVMMPGLSGYDVVRMIRERYPGLMLPVMLISANGHEDQVVEGLQAGANDYVTKPFGQRELVARIVTQLRTKTFTAQVAAGSSDGSDGSDAEKEAHRKSLEEENAALKALLDSMKERKKARKSPDSDDDSSADCSDE